MDKSLQAIELTAFWSVLICVLFYYAFLLFDAWSARDKQKQHDKAPKPAGKNYSTIVNAKLMSSELDEIEQALSN